MLPGLRINIAQANLGAQVVLVAGACAVVAKVALAQAQQHITGLVAEGKQRTAVEVGAVAQFAYAMTCPQAPAHLLAIGQKLTGIDRIEGGDTTQNARPALPGAGALGNLDTGDELGVDKHHAIALLVTVDAEVLPHAVDVHIHPAVVLQAANIHRQARVTLVYGGVHAGGFFQQVGHMAWRAAVDLRAVNHRHRAGLQVHLLALGQLLALDQNGLQLQCVVGYGAARKRHLVGAVKAKVHRRATNQLLQRCARIQLSGYRVGGQVLQPCAVEQYLHTGLLGIDQHRTIKRLGRDIKAQQLGLRMSGCRRLRCLGMARRQRQGHAKGDPVEQQ